MAEPLPAPGDVLEGKVEIRRLLGRGGMGAVFEALHRRTGRRVAVKVLRAELAADDGARSRFLQEALACGRVRHPNVVDIVDASIADGRPYLVMELLEGETLAERISREGPLPIADAVELVGQALAGLGAAHERGIVHRDLKPDNIFLARTASGGMQVKVLDFGISKVSGDADSFAATALALTRTGAVLGTPYYMSPEQAHGRKDIDARTDVYSIGAVLFHALTGRPPYLADNYNSLIAQILLDAPPLLGELRPDVPHSLVRIVETAMAKNRDERFASIADLAGRLARQTRVLPDVVVMMTDLDGFNAYALAAPVEDVEVVLEEWERVHRGVLDRHAGTLRAVIADEMVMTFPTMESAVAAWLELRDPEAYVPAVRPQIRFRAGLARGEVRIVRSAMYGEALNLAARITADGEVGVLAMPSALHATLDAGLRARFAEVPTIEKVPRRSMEALRAQAATAVWLRLAGAA